MKTGTSRALGISLLGVLVSIAIVAALAFLFFPAIGISTQKAKAAKCLQNLRQLHIALGAYASEHHGFFPVETFVEQEHGQEDVRSDWISSLRAKGYIKYESPTFTPERFLVYCPGSSVVYEAGDSRALMGHYGINTRVAGRVRRIYGANSDRAPVPISRIQFPSRTLLLLDSGYLALPSAFLDTPGRPGNYAPGLPTNQQVAWPSATRKDLSIKKDALEGRHGRRIHLLMVDGHVESWSPEELLKDRSIWSP